MWWIMKDWNLNVWFDRTYAVFLLTRVLMVLDFLFLVPVQAQRQTFLVYVCDVLCHFWKVISPIQTNTHKTFICYLFNCWVKKSMLSLDVKWYLRKICVLFKNKPFSYTLCICTISFTYLPNVPVTFTSLLHS